MRPYGRWVLGGLAGVGLLVALAWVASAPAPQPEGPAPLAAPDATPHPAPRAERAPKAPRPAPAGLQLGSREGPGRQSTAQAIYRTALLELQRMDHLDERRARDTYLRGRAALERVEDELDHDDEPGHVRLRADIDALGSEMRRLYEQPEP